MTDHLRPFPTLPREKRPRRRRVASLIEYDGRGFHGFQRQPEQRTVEGELIKCLQAMGLTGGLGFASRTDTGVHAHGQVVCFNVGAEADLTEVADQLRRSLPSEISLRALVWAPSKFHPRWTATGKRYTYTIAWSPQSDPRVWVLEPVRLDAALAELRVAPELTGFTAAGGKLGPMPPLTSLSADHTPERVRLTIEAPAFARYAIRHMVGCVVAQAQGLVPIGTVARTAIEAGPYRGLRAPPDGLVLERVFYPPALDPFEANGGH